MTVAIDEHTQHRKVRLKRMPKAYGGHYTAIVDSNGKSHAYLNAAVPMQNGQPSHPLHTAVCEVCGHAYSHLMGAGTVCCEECRSDSVAIHGLNVQEECGVDLGWKACELVDRRDRIEGRELSAKRFR